MRVAQARRPRRVPAPARPAPGSPPRPARCRRAAAGAPRPASPRRRAWAQAPPAPSPHGAGNPRRGARRRPPPRRRRAPARRPARPARPRAPPRPASPARQRRRARRDACAMSSRPCCSIWPWISTSVSPSRRSSATEAGWSLTKARPRPSAPTMRRRVSTSSSSRPCSASTACAGWSLGRSNEAATEAWVAPRRTAADSARLPSARPSASIRMDLPAPVSPVSAPRPPLARAHEVEVELLDQHEVADRKRDQHAAGQNRPKNQPRFSSDGAGVPSPVIR